ncbi:MAG: alpha/beta fold hydrolase [Solirubrobacteraceae bacterium]
MTGIEHEVRTPDGRTLLVLERGVPDGIPVLTHNGTPNSRLMWDCDVACAERHRVRIICYDRPGYGGSTRHEDRSIGSCAQDVRAIARALGIARLPVWGISGGGPHALACAALLPDLVPAVAELAGPAPWGADGLDYFEGMGELNVEDIELVQRDRAAAYAKCESDRAEMLAAEPGQLLEMLSSLLSPVDAAILSGALADYLVQSARSGLAPGPEGWWDDGIAQLSPWGFELDLITTPVQIWHGRHDQFVPFGHGRWLATHVPGADAHLSDQDGHLSLTANHLDEIYTWLLGQLGR